MGEVPPGPLLARRVLSRNGDDGARAMAIEGNARAGWPSSATTAAAGSTSDRSAIDQPGKPVGDPADPPSGLVGSSSSGGVAEVRRVGVSTSAWSVFRSPLEEWCAGLSATTDGGGGGQLARQQRCGRGGVPRQHARHFRAGAGPPWQRRWQHPSCCNEHVTRHLCRAWWPGAGQRPTGRPSSRAARGSPSWTPDSAIACPVAAPSLAGPS